MEFAGLRLTKAGKQAESDAERFVRLTLEHSALEQAVLAPSDENDPRRVASGTSYNAKGALAPDGLAYVEQGSSIGSPTREIVPQLANRRQAIQTYDRMTNNDAAVDVSLRAAKTPVEAATYFVEPFDDTEESRVVAEFVEFNLLQGMSTPFMICLEEILRMYEYGFSVLEPVYELREWAPKKEGANRRVYTMLRKLAPRPATSLKEFTYDDAGGPVAMVHNAVRADGTVEEVTIPIEKLIIFTFNKKGGNLEGKSILRTAYKHWYYTETLEKIDGIQKERHGIGIPKIELLAGYKDTDVQAAWNLVTELRTNERAGIVQPPGMNIGFAKPEGELVNVLTSIEHHRNMVMLNVMVQFLMLGMTSGGGRATSASHMNMFEKSLKYVANTICEYFNLFLIPRLVAYNFNTWKFPKLAVRNVGEIKDTQMWASALSNLASQNLITLDLETEQWVRSIIDAPLKLGSKQTPEANAGGNSFGNNKGGVQTEGNTDQSGNIGEGIDEG